MTLQKKIIIADDDPGIQDVAKLIFERANYIVDIFPNGDPLLNGNFDLPDLFILDRQLSGVDGLDICRHLKACEETSHIPIIIISASPQIGKMATVAGADAFVEKPFKMRDFRELVRRVIENDGLSLRQN